MYIINDYQLVASASHVFLSHDNKGAKIANQTLINILKSLQQQAKHEISEEELNLLAVQFSVDIEQLKTVLIKQLDILKPLKTRKFPKMYISSDDELVSSLLYDSFISHYDVLRVSADYLDFSSDSLVLFYRNNYSHTDFKKLYHHLKDGVYVITAGVLNKLLIIDNLYFNGSGLPTHVSTLHQLMAYLHSDVPATKNNWLLYYRGLVKDGIESFPEPAVNACQQGYIAYCLFQFASQFTNLWKKPTPLDQLNWFWQADLTAFTVHREVAIHSPFSEYDMKLDITKLPEVEFV